MKNEDEIIHRHSIQLWNVLEMKPLEILHLKRIEVVENVRNKVFFCSKQKLNQANTPQLYRLRVQFECIYQCDGIRTHN